MSESDQDQDELERVMAAAQGWRTAVIEKDWLRVANLMTYEAIARQIAVIVYGCGYSPWAQEPEIAASLSSLLSKHGIDFRANTDFPKNLILGPALVELMAWLEINAPVEEWDSQKKFREYMRAVSFSSFKLIGTDKAQATMLHNERTRRIQFVKSDNQWLLKE